MIAVAGCNDTLSVRHTTDNTKFDLSGMLSAVSVRLKASRVSVALPKNQTSHVTYVKDIAEIKVITDSPLSTTKWVWKDQEQAVVALV